MIDAGLIAGWDRETTEAVAKFDQGDLVESPPLFYAATPTHAAWATTALIRDEVGPDEELVVEVDSEDRPPYGVITSQGCDVSEVVRKPWFQVAPVYSTEPFERDERWMREIRRDAVPHLVLLDPPTLEGAWIADLRLEMPIEKSWLTGREPIAGFGDEERRRYFASRLAGRLDRPALPDALHDAVVRPLRRWLDHRGTTLNQALADAGVEFRLLTSTEEESITCRLLVIGCRGEIPESVVKALDEWWSRLESNNDRDDVVMLGCRFATSDEITMREYRASVLLDDRFLGPAEAVA